MSTEVEDLRRQVQERDAEIARLRTELEALGRQEPFDAGDQSFRDAFEKALRGGNWPSTRKGYGYRSPMTQMAWEVAFATVNYLPLYARPVPAPASVPQEAANHIIDSLQSQFDTEGITELDSGDALIRLSGAIAAVEEVMLAVAPKPEAPASVPDEWEVGVLMAVSVLMSVFDEQTIAANVLNELGLSKADCSDLDEFDKSNLRRVQGEMGGRIALVGLDDGSPKPEGK